MKIIVLGGFLGAGKTTVLLQLAHLIADGDTGDQIPLVILENEIGEVSVDSAMLGGFEVRELFAGCICCTLAGDLTSTIREIQETCDPKYVLVETTGMAQPGKVVETIGQYARNVEKIAVLVLADAGRWEELMEFMDVFIEKQMESADCILLNKADLVPGETVEKIQREIRNMNPSAAIYPVCARESIEKELREFLGGIEHVG